MAVTKNEMIRNEGIIKQVLEADGIRIREIRVWCGPSVSQYRVYLETGMKASKIMETADDMALAMGKVGIRAYLLSDCMGIEIPNDERDNVPVGSIIQDTIFQESTAKLPLALGRTFTYSPIILDLATAPHILVAGATKQGKTECLGAMVASLMAGKNAKDVKLIRIDSKAPEYDVNVVMEELSTLVSEMESRKSNGQRFPFIVCMIDEYADLTVPFGLKREIARYISNAIIRLAQEGVKVGIHLIISTQRPSREVITGLIKSNFPTRIAFRTASQSDSKIILDSPGAEKLIGRGDMLLWDGSKLLRVQSAFAQE